MMKTLENFRNYEMSCVLIAINLLTNINFLEIFHEFRVLLRQRSAIV